MLIIHSINEMYLQLNKVRREGKTIGLVPTMGALHAGHMALVKQCVQENDIAVVTVFVNPTQFNNPDDLEKYPRDLKRDAQLLENELCTIVFAPSRSEIYSPEELNETFEFDFGGLDTVMEGKFRPGHFNGVVQIVSKLFHIVQPHKAYFGEKDFQQLAVIHRMNQLMGFNVQIVDFPIVREPSGLAMSSRNERLSPEQRNIAAQISKVLFECRNFVPTLPPLQVKQYVEDQIQSVEGLTLEYFEIVDVKTLQPVTNWEQPSVGCIAVYCGDVRLIDNIRCT